MHNNMLRAIIIVMTTGIAAMAADDDIHLVQSGRPVAEIIVAANADPSVKAAGQELQKYLAKISGAMLPIVNAPGGKTLPVYVGRSEYTDQLGITLADVRHDGFKIIVTNEFIALLGVDRCRPAIPRCNVKFGATPSATACWQADIGRKWAYPNCRDPRETCQPLGFNVADANGTLYAVYEFLERLGMRWFMPMADLGQVIPKLESIHVPPLQLKIEPRFEFRFFLLRGLGGNPEEFLWQKWLKQGGVSDPWPAHTAQDITKFQQDRPELIAYRGGHPIKCGHYDGRDVLLPRLASPELRAELAEYLAIVHDRFPELPYLAIGQPDGWIMLDDRDVAAGWDKTAAGSGGRFTDYTWDFVLDVAKRVRAQCPGVKFSTFTYGYNLNLPDLADGIPSDISAFLCMNTTHPGLESELDRLAEWSRKAPANDFFIYDYYLNHVTPSPPVPVIFTRQLQKFSQALNARCRGVYTEVAWTRGEHPAYRIRLGLPGINHLMIHLNCRLAWDRDLDLQATLADYYAQFYGPAQTEMREFFEYAESVWMRPGPRNLSAFSGFLKPADIPGYFEILARAKAVAGDTIYGQRIDLIAREIEPLQKLFSELARTGPYVRVRAVDRVPVIDGDLNKPFWTERFAAERTGLREIKTGAAPKTNGAAVAFRWLPDKSLLVGITCLEGRMDSLRAHTPATARDDSSIYNDDNIELHLETPAGYSAVVVVNPHGAVRDSCVTPDAADVPGAWSVEQVAARKLADRWTVEIKISGLGDMPTKSYPWGVNVFRQRLAGGEFEGYALSPTGTGKFLGAPDKMGNLYGP